MCLVIFDSLLPATRAGVPLLADKVWGKVRGERPAGKKSNMEKGCNFFSHFAQNIGVFFASHIFPQIFFQYFLHKKIFVNKIAEIFAAVLVIANTNIKFCGKFCTVYISEIICVNICGNIHGTRND